jgi:hypothetical protein
MKFIYEPIRKFAELLVIADLVDNFKDTWEKMGKNPEEFQRITDPFIKRYLDTHVSAKDISELRKAILKATNEEVTLSFEKGKWTTKPKGQSVLQP